VIAHGGTTGLVIELGVALVAGVGLATIWWRERRRRAQRDTTNPP
jgi:hypothetical protein